MTRRTLNDYASRSRAGLVVVGRIGGGGDLPSQPSIHSTCKSTLVDDETFAVEFLGIQRGRATNKTIVIAVGLEPSRCQRTSHVEVSANAHSLLLQWGKLVGELTLLS